MLLLLVTPESKALKGFTDALEAEADLRLTLANTGLAALEIAKSKKPDLVIVGENVPDFAAKELLLALMQVNAMINTAVVSDMSEEAFHEFYEGFGVLMRLPQPPDENDARALLEKARSVPGIS